MTDSKPILPRSAPRLRTLKAGRVVFNSDYSSYDVIIRDMSDSGIRLKLSNAFIVPRNFELVIPNPNTGILVRRACRTVWQRGDQVGAHFLEASVGDDPAATPMPPAPPRLRRKPISG
jgi:hypothetical protein